MTEARQLISCLHEACGKGEFSLTKFVWNKRDVLEIVPEEERSEDVKTLDLNYEALPIEKALGVHWCVKSDTFGFCIVVKDKRLMRRGILSSLSCLLPPRVRSTVYINHQEASLRPLQRGETQMG